MIEVIDAHLNLYPLNLDDIDYYERGKFQYSKLVENLFGDGIKVIGIGIACIEKKGIKNLKNAWYGYFLDLTYPNIPSLDEFDWIFIYDNSLLNKTIVTKISSKIGRLQIQAKYETFFHKKKIEDLVKRGVKIYFVHGMYLLDSKNKLIKENDRKWLENLIRKNKDLIYLGTSPYETYFEDKYFALAKEISKKHPENLIFESNFIPYPYLNLTYQLEKFKIVKELSENVRVKNALKFFED